MNTPENTRRPDARQDNSEAAEAAEAQGKFEFHPLLDKNAQPVYATAPEKKDTANGQAGAENRHGHATGHFDPGFGATDRG